MKTGLEGRLRLSSLAIHFLVSGTALLGSEQCVVPIVAGELLVVPIEFRGREYTFALDTGTDVILYDSIFREQLGSPMEEPGELTSVDGTRSELARFVAPAARLGPFSVQTPEWVGCIDLERLRQVTGQNIHGILGMSVLHKYVLDMDFDNGLLTISKGARSETENAGSSRLIFFRERNRPAVLAAVCGTVEPVLLDTGCNSTGTLRAKLFDDLVKDGVAKALPSTRSLSITGESRSSMARVPNFKLGSLAHTNLAFARGTSSSIGLGYLRRFRVVLDFPRLKLDLWKSAQHDMPELIDRSGLSLVVRDDRVVVETLDAQSPAEKWGIQKGDVLLRVGDIPALPANLYRIRRQVGAQTNGMLRFLLDRGGATKEVMVLPHPSTE